MTSNRYQNTNVIRHMWLGLAVFLVLFNSMPVKKYIRLHLMHQMAPIASTTPLEFRSEFAKDCTLIERHDLSFISLADTLQAADADNDFAVSLFIAAAAFLFAVPVTRKLTHAAEHTLTADNVPVYLHHCRLQV